MKKINVIASLLVAVLLAAVNFGAQAQTSAVANELVNVYNSPEIQKQMLSSGYFSKFTAEAKGNDVLLKLYFKDSAVDFSSLSLEEIKSLKNDLADSFLGSMTGGGAQGEMAKALFKSEGIRFVFIFYDRHGHNLSKTIGFD